MCVQKKMFLASLMFFLFLFPNLFAQNSNFLHIDLSVSTGIPIIWGQETNTTYIGGSVMPEFRIRFFPSTYDLNVFGSIGYSGVSSMFNPSDTADESRISATPFEKTPIYFSIGGALNINEEERNSLNTGISNIFFGVGYINSKVGIDDNAADVYDAGLFIYFGISTNILTFGFF